MNAHASRIMLSCAACCLIALAFVVEPERVSPQAPDPAAASQMVFSPPVIIPDRARVDPLDPNLFPDRDLLEWPERARERGHCFELDAREGVFACVVHRHRGSEGTVAGRLFLGDASGMKTFYGPVYMSMSQPGPSPRLDVTIEVHGDRGYWRHERGWRAREKARRAGLVDRTDHATGAFFTEAPERGYDQGQAPLFMRRADAAAFRCGDTLHRFSPITPERARELFEHTPREATPPGGSPRVGVALDRPEATGGPHREHVEGRARLRRAMSDPGPCVFLFGPPTPAQARRTRELSEERAAALEIEELPTITWCVEQEDVEPGEDLEAMWQLEERMSARVARDAAELARRLHGVLPDRPSDGFGGEAYAPADLKRVYEWWARLGYDERPEAVRLEVMTRLFGKTPTRLRLEAHTSTGERFLVEFDRCARRHSRGRISVMR